MKRNNDVRRLKEAAHIRDIQRLSAETDAIRAAAFLKCKQEVQDSVQHEQRIFEESWAAATSNPSLRLEIAPLWAAAVLKQQRLIVRSIQEVESATNELNRRKQEWRSVTTQHDLMETSVCLAAKELRHKHEEIALNNAADQFVLRWRAP